jgi:hypothetical protein
MASCNPIKTDTPSGQIIKTSDVSIYDGIVLSCITGITPGTSNLNDVIAATDAAICALTTPSTSEVLYDGSLTLGACSINITPAVNPTTNDAFESIAEYLCNVETTINNRIDILNTTDLTISAATAAEAHCFGTFTDATELNVFLQALSTHICGLPTPQPATVVDLYDYESITRGERVWTGVGGDSTHNSGSLVPSISGVSGFSRYYINGIKYIVADTTVALSSTSDNYVDLNTSGNYVVTSVAVGSPAPPTASDTIRIAQYETDGSGVVSYTDLREHKYQDGERWFDDSVITRHITDLNVTGAKLELFGTAGTNDWSLASMTLDTKGRVQSWTNNTTITSLSDKDILQYNAGTGNWENVNLTSATTIAGSIQGETLYYDVGSVAYLPSTYLRNMPNSVGIGATVEPTAGFQVGYGVAEVIELGTISTISSATANTGTLAANTYYYTVTAMDEAGGETLADTEEFLAVDGILQTSIILSWTDVERAFKYRIYKGTVSGTYTEYFDVSADTPTYTDDGTVGTAGSPLTIPTAFSVTLNTGGLAIGASRASDSIVTIRDLGSVVENGISVELGGGTKTIDTIGIISNVTSTNTADNVGGWFSVLNGANNYVLRVEDGVDNTGKFLKVIDSAGNVSFGNAGINIEDEGVSVLTDVNVIDFIGTGVTASSPSAGRVEVTVTGGANSLNDLIDVTAPSANDWDTLAYDLGIAQWVTSGALSNDLTNVAIGDKPGAINARLHINSTNGSDLLLVEDSVVGVICDIDTSGVLTYNERFKYTFNNGGAAPLGANKFLMSADALGNAQWQDIPAYGIGFNGTIDYVTRWVTNTDLGIGVIRDDGSTVSIGVAPNSTSQVDIESGRLNTLRLEQTGSLPSSTIIDASTSFTGALSGNTKLVKVLAGGSSHTGVMQGVHSTVGTTATSHNTGVVGAANNGINHNIGVDGASSGSQTIDVGVRAGAGAGTSLTTISASFSAIGVASFSGANANNLKDSAVFYGQSIAAHANDNYGLVLNLTTNTGGGTQYIGRFDDNRTVGAGKFLMDIDGGGTAEWRDLPANPAAGITFNGIQDYVTVWEPDGVTLGTGLIRDNQTTVGVNNAPDGNSMVFVNGSSSTINGMTVVGNHSTSPIGINTYAVSGATKNQVVSTHSWVAGIFTDAGVNVGVRGGANEKAITGISSITSTGDSVGGYFESNRVTATTSYGVIGLVDSPSTDASAAEFIGGRFIANDAGTNYSLQLQDGTESVGRFLKNVAVNGKANWSDILLSDITDPYVYEHVTVSVALAHNTGTEHTIFADTSSNDVTINLPPAASNSGRVFLVKKTAAANKVVLDGNLAETIDGVATHEMFGLYDWVKVQCDGSNWFVIA